MIQILEKFQISEPIKTLELINNNEPMKVLKWVQVNEPIRLYKKNLKYEIDLSNGINKRE